MKNIFDIIVSRRRIAIDECGYFYKLRGRGSPCHPLYHHFGRFKYDKNITGCGRFFASECIGNDNPNCIMMKV